MVPYMLPVPAPRPRLQPSLDVISLHELSYPHVIPCFLKIRKPNNKPTRSPKNSDKNGLKSIRNLLTIAHSEGHGRIWTDDGGCQNMPTRTIPDERRMASSMKISDGHKRASTRMDYDEFYIIMTDSKY